MTTLEGEEKQLKTVKLSTTFNLTSGGDLDWLILNIVDHQVYPLNLPGEERQAETFGAEVNASEEHRAQIFYYYYTKWILKTVRFNLKSRMRLRCPIVLSLKIVLRS